LATTECPPGDTMGVLKAGDSLSAPLHVRAGQTVPVTVEFQFAPARVHGLWYGIRAPGSPDELMASAVEIARRADAAVVIVGETSDSSVESKDRPDTRLAGRQIELIEKVAAANPRTVVVANVGHAYDAEWNRSVPAHLSVWYPGEGFSTALAAVLAGDREPGGRMPLTIAAEETDYPGYSLEPDGTGQLPYAEGTGIGYRGLLAAGKRAGHAFGAGEGYARFEWCDAAAEGDGVAVTVTNVSDRAGCEVVQVYREGTGAALVGFAKLHLQPGASQRVQVALPRRRFARWGERGWEAPTEPVDVRVARHAEDPGTRVELSFDTLPSTGL
jgi:beta-glucosidase